MKPKMLKPGDTIGIISPASPTDPEQRELALQVFSLFGFRVKLGQSVFQQYGYLAGNDEIRANDLNQMFCDPEVDAIICMRGGYGSPRILPFIDYEAIRLNPKIFVGYSDITALHLAIQKKVGLVTFHGPMVFQLARKPDWDSWNALFRNLMDPRPIGRYMQPPDLFQFVIHEGKAEGKLIGGNLTLLAATIGTPYEVETEGKILFIEEIGEEPYRIDRMLTQLLLAGKLQAASGVIFTDFTDCSPKDEEKSLTLMEVLHEIMKPLGIPSFYGLKAGHTRPNFTLPIGVRARMNAKEGILELIEGGVQFE